MVECESKDITDSSGNTVVLIDTWWNVNASNTCLEFIEELGFNRYMVECEFTKIVISCLGCSSFNRYMVECEFIFKNNN